MHAECSGSFLRFNERSSGSFKKKSMPKGSTHVSVESVLSLSHWLKFVARLAHSTLQHCLHMLVVKNCDLFL